MREYQPIDTVAQKEALINEFKGNLFEYLVAQNLSRHFKIEGDFVRSFGGDIRRQLTEYDHWLRVNEPTLIKHLPILATSVSKELIPSLPIDVDKILVIGKSAGGSHNKAWDEADIIVESKSGIFPVSLKLCKSHAFVNTKSAGIKSFISQYFGAFDKSQYFQNLINDGVERRFLQMANELHDKASIEFFGRFDHRWTDAGFSELPGQLETDYNKIVVQTYYDCVLDVYNCLSELKNNNVKLFSECILPLIGIGNPDIIQATCFHKEKKGEKYLPSGVHIVKSSDLISSEEVEILPLKEGISSFELRVGKIRLQIRIKPMNKFTSAAFKVNCSIKELV
ncbi:hypothetical protein [Halobacteriovorax sp.]|uniref:hypothetical protein n=1 Tax=Halobacteriovorax sp. TaxID=2020862 RepID=UPI003567EBC1